MTLAEYRTRRDAYELRQADQQQMIAIAAFYSRAVEQTEQRGDKKYYKYTQLSHLYDLAAKEAEIFGEEVPQQFEELVARYKRLEIYRERKAAGDG